MSETNRAHLLMLCGLAIIALGIGAALLPVAEGLPTATIGILLILSGLIEIFAGTLRQEVHRFAAAAGAVRAGTPPTEYELQQQMVGWFAEAGLVSDSAPVVAVGPHAGDPHYLPTKESATVIGPDELLLLDLWGKLGQTGAVFADITWVGFTGRQVPPRMAKAFDAAARARDAAVELVQAAAKEGRDLRGWEVDRAARAVLVASGFEAQVLHRTGHSLGESVHGNGAHLDDFETHDERRLLPGTGFTVEPGVYMADFGVRTEINVFRGDREALVTGPCQGAIIPLLS